MKVCAVQKHTVVVTDNLLISSELKGMLAHGLNASAFRCTVDFILPERNLLVKLYYSSNCLTVVERDPCFECHISLILFELVVWFST